ncbi:MAG: hypothetical protein V2I56_19395 [Desulfobacteraceae bacterium]|nr:hypothetical protein [Desulfobacteraceae bacterium]
MVRKKRAGVQIRFNPESEKDVICFFSRLKKAEVHLAAVSAFRMYMRAVGFYESWLSGQRAYQGKNTYDKRPIEYAEASTRKKGEGIYDKEALRLFNGLFDDENAPAK